MWRNLSAGLALALIAASPALATDLNIEVAGKANGMVKVHLLDDIAPNHVKRLVALANEGAYDGVVFHRVIDGFMAQTGDVKFGKQGGDLSRAGTGGSDKPDLKAEFSDAPFERGTVGMARSMDPDSANSQFFIMFAPAPHLNGQYTVVGKVVSGMDVVDQIKRGTGQNGAVTGTPDVMKTVTVSE
ncbi:peptidylprolyl isomerase [Aquicoccus sp. G2-2]|uniref:peptidylprolyl isomerase n=1 Tax=Aquicoccus sp. G2-2 TaxID=3092120 RepID=UPI002AE00465|nr:peptidylprolyl isomerase [Aquicoccus sp. G2-2]MEA1112872.1 peptidylprolyl isomerase [Aquicoccus sp. G2-2]